MIFLFITFESFWSLKPKWMNNHNGIFQWSDFSFHLFVGFVVWMGKWDFADLNWFLENHIFHLTENEWMVLIGYLATIPDYHQYYTKHFPQKANRNSSKPSDKKATN
jgi:hypothetical protein